MLRASDTLVARFRGVYEEAMCRGTRRLKPQGLAPAQRLLQDMASYWPDRQDAISSFLDLTRDQP